MKIWLPAIRSDSGTDIFTERLLSLIESCGGKAEITWFPHHYEWHPWDLKKAPVPSGIDVIWANSWNGFAFKRGNLPLVVTAHHCSYDPSFRPYQTASQRIYNRFFIKFCERLSFSAASKITSVSQFTASRYNTLGSNLAIEPFRLWIDDERYSPAGFSGFRFNNKFTLIFVGNLTRRKGSDLLPHIMDLLGENFLLKIVGGLRRGEGFIHPQICSLGYLDEMALINEYRSSDAMLFPTRYEGFGYSVLEAMSCGLPVVSTSCSALPEVVGADTGLLCPVDDVYSYAEACKALKKDRDFANKISRSGRERVEHFFSINSRREELISLLASVLK